MRQEQIVDALNLLEDDILKETDALRRQSRLAAVRWKQMAACIAACLVLTSSWWIIFRYRSVNVNNDKEPSVSKVSSDINGTEISNGSGEELPSEGEVDGLPLLSVMDFSATGAAGFGAEMAYDVSELVSGNPWGESDYFSTLPVYQNPISIDVRNDFKVTGMDIEKM